jgi:hypothetical protein
MMQLGNATGREIFVARTAQAKSYSEGFAYRRKAVLTAAYNKRIAPVRSFVSIGGTPLMQTTNGLVAIVPMDYVYWSPQVESLVSSAGRMASSGSPGPRASLPPRTSRVAAGPVVPRAGSRLGN